MMGKALEVVPEGQGRRGTAPVLTTSRLTSSQRMYSSSPQGNVISKGTVHSNRFAYAIHTEIGINASGLGKRQDRPHEQVSERRHSPDTDFAPGQAVAPITKIAHRRGPGARSRAVRQQTGRKEKKDQEAKTSSKEALRRNPNGKSA